VAGNIGVLAVTSTYPTSEMPGDSPCIRDQILALRAQGVSVDLLRIDRSKGKLGYAIAAWSLLLTSFQSKRYDLIHAYYGHCGLVARLQLKYPVVVTFQGSDLLGRKDGAIGRLVARLVDGVIVMSEEMKCVAKRNDAHIIPFGVDLDLFHPYPMGRARLDLGLPLGDRLVLFPWDPDRAVKRFDIVKDAIQLLQEEHGTVRLVVAFNEPHGIVAKYMNACDAIVLASDHEGAPMAIREAIACGLPIVSVDVGDVREAIGGIEGCYLCRQEAGDLAEKLAWVLSQRVRIDGARAAREMSEARAAEQVVSVYKLVLNKSPDDHPA